MVGSPDRRTYTEIRYDILNSLLNNTLSINEVASKTKIYWPTVKQHLTYLRGMYAVDEVLKHSRLRLFKITFEGKKYMKKLKENGKKK